MPDLAVAGPLGELHLGHEAQLNPVGPLRERSGRRRVEPRNVDRDGLEESAELAAKCIVPPSTRADLPGEPECTSLLVPDEDRADTFARAFGLGEPADDELLPPNAFGLAPVAPSANRPGRVPCGTY